MVSDSIEVKSTTSIDSTGKKKAYRWFWKDSTTKHQHKTKKSNSKGLEQENTQDLSFKVGDFEIHDNRIRLFGKVYCIDRTGQEPIDGDEKYIYSEEVATGPYSFYDSNKEYDNKAPPPLYFKFEDLNKPKPTDKDEVLAAFKVNDNGYLECTDEAIIEGNKGVIPYVLKQLAKNVFTGKGIVSISLPVRIFQPKSLLERILDACSFVPTFFKKAWEVDDEVLRMKYVISFIVSGMYMSADLRKPFNPILGETLEGYFKDGTRIYMEHTSHHPPISSYLMEGPPEYNFKMYGSVEFKGAIKSAGNILNILFEGANFVEFPDGHKIEFHYPTTRVSGLLWGDRTVNIEGTGILIDHTYKNRGIVVFDPAKPEFDNTDRPTSFEGLIYKSKSKVLQKKAIKSLCDVTDIEKKICDIYGNVLKELVIDDEWFWNIEEYIPYRMFPVPNCIPSDSRFREDLIWLVYGDQNYSQEWKSKLEVQQRFDKKLRQDCEKKRGKKGKFVTL